MTEILDIDKTLESITSVVVPAVAALMMPRVLNGLQEIGREYVRLKLEKRLGHPMSDENWQTYYREAALKEMVTPWVNWLDQLWQQEINRRVELRRQAMDQKIIKDFVWEGR
jgi:hypothetical protein